MKLRALFITGFALLFGTAMWIGAHPDSPTPKEPVVEDPQCEVSMTPEPVGPPWSERTVTVPYGQSITAVLAEQGISPEHTRALIQTAQPYSNLVKIRAGESLTFRITDGIPQALVRPLDRWREKLLVINLQGDPTATLEYRPVVRTPRTASGEVDASLWETGVSMGLQPENLLDLAKVFAWDIDFNTELHRGDRFRLVIEEIRDARTHSFVRYGNILAAEYHRTNGEVFIAYRYQAADGTVAYYDANGESNKAAFLKSPIEFSSVSSRFGRRYHPILKRWRAHRGTDYSASRGTPIRSVGEGTVRFVGRKGGYGRHVRVQHDDQYASSYSHLSSASVRVGQRINQGDVIGRVGSTGLATGPHLHFEFYNHGKQINYASLDVERTLPIASYERPEFEQMLSTIQPLLEQTPLPNGTCSPPLLPH